MHRGYTKRWRKRWDKDYHHDLLLFVMMEYFIDFANWKDKEFPFVKKGVIIEMVKIKRGQCFFTYKGLADFLNGPLNKVSRKMVRRRVGILEKMEFLELLWRHQYQIASILNYDLYNPIEINEGHIRGHHRDITGTSQGHHRDTTKKDKNIKKVKKDKSYPSFFSKNLKDKIEFLEHTEIFKGASDFVKELKNKNKDDKIINHAFNQLYKKCKNGDGDFEQWSKKRAWGYCQKIIDAETQIQNARESEAESEKHKNIGSVSADISGFINSIGKPVDENDNLTREQKIALLRQQADKLKTMG